MKKILIKNAQIVNENRITEGDVRIVGQRIENIGQLSAQPNETVHDIEGRYLFPGAIDDQVHFREPGLTHKADIYHESRAAVAGGVTSFMEMPNVKPATLTMELLRAKKDIAANTSIANYAFYLGASTDNIEDIKAAVAKEIAGVKIFMGASTGNMLVDDDTVLEQIFQHAPTLIATHCENSPRIQQRLKDAEQEWGDAIPPHVHPIIRDVEACYQSSSKAIQLARQTGARLHILHITTAKELDLFTAGDLAGKQITAEACAHHLLFNDADYQSLGNRLKCNPAVKTADDQVAIHNALRDRRIDILATDHAPHLPSEKDGNYQQSAAGLPLVEYALPAYLQMVKQANLTLPDIARLSAHQVADLFDVENRGYIRESYFADLVVVEPTTDSDSGVRSDVISKCGWTPFVDYQFDYRINTTYVNGTCVWQNNQITNEESRGLALEFNR